MAVHIRLQRRGSVNRAFYHLVAADHRACRDGRFIEKLGYYNPNKEPSEVEVRAERLQHWFERGAVLSNAAKKLVKIKQLTLSRKPGDKKEAQKSA